MKTQKFIFFIFTLFFTSPLFAVHKMEDSATILQACIACHGENGISNNDEWPNLAHQKKGYLKNQLYAFKNGSRENPLMSAVVKMLSEEQIEALATYFSQIAED